MVKSHLKTKSGVAGCQNFPCTVRTTSLLPSTAMAENHFIRSDREAISLEICKDLTLLAGLAVWIANPLPQVGSTTAPIASVPTGCDYASRTGCKSQSYTSWGLIIAVICDAYCMRRTRQQ
ncbi:Hypothetical protein CINCED_3A025139 [Cinara cedri]|uniref:Uncharacterized protein n=1 Tax=Cinara cedri TaxID=506608 RepID=A0A5E4NMV1_9HEMI|nr:Hypothetical protein CINCED_3A025139 [Cinara cedri]